MKRLSKHSLSISAGDVAGWIALGLIALAFWAVVAVAAYGTLSVMFWFFLDYL